MDSLEKVTSLYPSSQIMSEILFSEIYHLINRKGDGGDQGETNSG